MKKKSPQSYYPPKLARWLLERIISKDIRDGALGDFDEIYALTANERNLLQARLWYWTQVAKSFPSFVLDLAYWKILLFRNYSIIAFRNMLKHKIFSFINITGLTIGLACFILVFLFIRFEGSYDKFHENYKQIYRVIKECVYERGIEYRADTGAPMSPLLLENFPEVVNAVRFTSFFEGLVSHNEKVFSEERFYFADPSVFDVFTFPLIKGIPEYSLNEPFTVVITPEIAEKYFGDEDPIGKVLNYRIGFSDKKLDLKVTGIFKKIPKNSHIEFDFIASYETLKSILSERFFTDHWSSTTYNYIQLKEDSPSDDLEKKLTSFAEKFVDKEEYKSLNLKLQPLKDIYFKSWRIGGGIWKKGDIQTIYSFTALALFILIFACVNFINLSTARLTYRVKEIGLRKVLGAQRANLIVQFLGESILYSLIGLIFALFLIQIFLPRFNSLINTELSMNLIDDFSLLVILILIAVVVGISAGIYPSLFLSSFHPVNILKKTYSYISSSIFHKALVVFQFSIAILLITGSIVIYKQINFVNNMDLGFNKKNLVTIPIQESSAKDKYYLVKHELLKSPNILGVTASSTITGVGSPNAIQMKGPGVENLNMGIIYVDYDYIETFGIKVEAGRHFESEAATDAENAFLVNQSFSKRLGWDDVVGKEIELFYIMNNRFTPMYDGRIVGLLRDFNFRTLYDRVQPVIFKIDPNRFNHIFIRINGDNIPDSIAFIKNTFKNLIPTHPLQFSFLDEMIEDAYQSEKNFGVILNYATFLSILVACLGLFGLTSLITQQRTKEIGIRKVLGASVEKVVLLLTKDYIKLIIISNVIAWPVGYYFMRNWLQSFVYRTSLGLGTFILIGLLTVVIAVLTVSFQAIKTAVSNPVDALQYE